MFCDQHRVIQVIPILASLPLGGVILGKLLNLSEPPFLVLSDGAE